MEKNWSQLWLNYRKSEDSSQKKYFESLEVRGFGESKIIANAVAELELATKAMFGVTIQQKKPDQTATLCIEKVDPEGRDGTYKLIQEGHQLSLQAATERGVLYGVFHILRLLSMGKRLDSIRLKKEPQNPLRMYNHWDNMTGDIERGYSGNSFFFVNNEIVIDERTRDYARFMASIGMNGIVINNVNVKQCASLLITDRYFDKVAELSRLFGEYGLTLYLSLNYASPIEIGGLDSADPFDQRVIGWWETKMKEIFRRIPNLGGFLVKADSEGRPGPFTYGRTQADGANMLADIVKPYGGIIIWRCFVYNCTQDWRDYKTDRARAGYDNFIEMDGDYHENVILQIKNGPMDFQIREPISPLFGGLQKTNQMLEVQIAQEYTGHQIDICYLIPMFKEILEFDTYMREKNSKVKDIISGRTLGNRYTGIAAVINTGNDLNWTGNVLAAANLYGFGRLAFDMELSAEEILEEWVALTFGTEERVMQTIKEMLLPSREIYEKHTSPLGIGWMVTPNVHYGCSVDGYEYSRWGTYHRADHFGMGVDRSHNGTGYALLYNEPNASMYDKPETCPEELLLFFHHIAYDYRLKSGKTLIQHIYDTVSVSRKCVEPSLVHCLVNIRRTASIPLEEPEADYENARERLDRQLYNAREWRDQVNSYFYRKSAIPDEKGRAIY